MALALPAVLLVLAQSSSDAHELRMRAEARRMVFVHARQCSRDEEFLNGERLLWAHAENGECLGELDEETGLEGVPRLHGQAVNWLVAAEPGEVGSEGLRGLTLALEYPAAAPARQRKRIEFHTQIRPHRP